MTPVPADFDRWDNARRRDWQLARIAGVVAHARATSAFYRDTWGDAAAPATWDDLRALPIVTKNMMIRHAGGQPQLEAARVGFSTRGTSGNPLVLWLDPAETAAYVAPTLRGFIWAGLQPGDRALILSPSWHRLAAMEGHAVVGRGAQPCYFWGTLSDPAHAAPFVDALLDVRPAFVTSTPPFILNVLKYCADRGIDPRAAFAPVRSVVLAGLALTPGLRRHLTDRLGAEVFERGGTQEGAALDECGHHSGMHVHEDVCLIEVLDKQGNPVPDGAPGRLVITKLVAAGSPFVRYDTGDTAAFVPGTCACGSCLPRLRILARPESTMMIEGRPVTGYAVRAILDEDPGLVGRVSLLVRDTEAKSRLRILIEGAPGGDDPEGVLRRAFGLSDVQIDWMGGAGLAWGFRQVIDARELSQRRAT
ncbi:MAG: hypothetical protein Q27BPR15_12455 [Rhodobacter sp. CACIA14H1]|nr:MAG: hypothetical protein Q27BPR15_12455 [Rhodobacter sp. CACIA14H1]